MKELKDALTEILNERGISQRELADKIGVTEVSMSRYCRGERIPRATIISSIAQALNVKPERLLGFDTESAANHEDEYYKAIRLILRYAKEWTVTQKANMAKKIILIMEDGE